MKGLKLVFSKRCTSKMWGGGGSVRSGLKKTRLLHLGNVEKPHHPQVFAQRACEGKSHIIWISKLTCKQRVFPQLPVSPTGFLSRPKYKGRPGPPSQEFHKFRGQFFSKSSNSLSAQLPQPMPFFNFSFSILYKIYCRNYAVRNFLSLALNFFWTFFFQCLREKSYGWISRGADWPTHLNDSS